MSAKIPLYKAIARTIQAIKNCEESKNNEWHRKHIETLAKFSKMLPSGSGFDSGCNIETESCNDTRIVITTSFHHMDENGSYDGWNQYRVIVKPCLSFDISLSIIGRNRNDFKDYAYETFQHCLTELVEEYPQ